MRAFIAADRATFEDIVELAGKFEDFLTGNPEPSEELYYDEETLAKVKRVLDNVKSIDYGGEEIISMLQNEGILFRERKPE
jgi:hypothetical protein